VLVHASLVPELRWLRRLTVAAVICGVAAISWNRVAAIDGQDVDWPVYRGDPKGNQYATLAQIHAANVHRLQPVWTYRAGDATQRSTMHVNPIVVEGVMYVTTPSLKAVALNAATGREIWVFDPAKHNNGNVVRLRNRGLVYWKGAEGERIFHFVRDRVYAVEAKTGALIASSI
jgi:quinoprotein glucose dehydrogenase